MKKLIYENDDTTKFFNNYQEASEYLGISNKWFIKHFIDGTSKLYPEYNKKFRWYTQDDELTDYGEILIIRDIPGVTYMEKQFGIPIKYTGTDGVQILYKSLFECSKSTGLSPAGIIRGLLNKGELRTRLQLNNNNEICHYVSEVS